MEFRERVSANGQVHFFYASDERKHVTDMTCGCEPRVSGEDKRTGEPVVNHNSTPEESSAREIREMHAWIRSGGTLD